jgi:hypothetical protein
MIPPLAELLSDTLDPRAIDAALRVADVPGVAPALVREHVLKLAPKLLDIAIPDLLTQALQDVVALREYADPDRHPPDELSVVPLGDYTIETEHHPAIEVRVDGALARKIEFDVITELVVSDSQVTVRDGKLWAARAGTLVVRSRVELCGIVLAKCESKLVDLPGSIELEEGLAIH